MFQKPAIAILAMALCGAGCASASFTTDVSLVTQTSSPSLSNGAFTALSASDACSAARGFANAGNETEGVEVSAVSGCGLGGNAISAGAQISDTFSCSTGCSIAPEESVKMALTVSGTIQALAGTQGFFSLTDTIKVGFQPVYMVFVSISNVGTSVNASGTFTTGAA